MCYAASSRVCAANFAAVRRAVSEEIVHRRVRIKLFYSVRYETVVEMLIAAMLTLQERVDDSTFRAVLHPNFSGGRRRRRQIESKHDTERRRVARSTQRFRYVTQHQCCIHDDQHCYSAD